MSSEAIKSVGADDDVVIRVSHVSKIFEMYAKPRHRLQQMIFGRWKKFYKEFKALDDIDFEIKRGECVGIIGRNGSGKSTILQIITGTLQPTTGGAWVKPGLRVAALLELGSGFNPEFTGRENVYMNASILGLSKKQTDAKFREIVDFADIGDFIDQPVKAYSSGMMVRLAFAVQVMVKPDILIVDEALAVGDAAFQRKCYARMEELIAGGTTLFLVTHDTETVNRMCSRCVFLKSGKVAMDGLSREVVAEYMRFSFQEDILEDMGSANSSDYSVIQENGKNVFQILPKKTKTKFGIGDGAITRIRIYGMSQDNVIMTPVKLCIRLDLEWDVEKVMELVKKENLIENIAAGVGMRDRRNISILGGNSFMQNMSIPVSYGKATVDCELDIPPLNKDQFFLDTALWVGGDPMARLPLDCGADASVPLIVDSGNDIRSKWGIIDSNAAFTLHSGK